MIWLYVCLGIAAGATAIGLFIYANNDWIKITRHKFVCGTEKKFKIAHLSDLHGKSFGRKNCGLVCKIAAFKPDCIVITGDIIHRYTDKNKRVALELVSSLAAVAPVLFSSGNHEMRNKGYNFFRRDLTEAGAQVLDDRAVRIDGVTFAGLNCASQKNGSVFKIKENLTEFECNAKVKILLAHKPQFAESYSPAGFDFILSGHAHGGQWRIPFTDIGFYAPGQGVFPKLTSGVHIFGESKLIISRGLGNSQCPLRLFNRPELVFIELE